jgi:hypothetical protein
MTIAGSKAPAHQGPTYFSMLLSFLTSSVLVSSLLCNRDAISKSVDSKRNATKQTPKLPKHKTQNELGEHSFKP